MMQYCITAYFLSCVLEIFHYSLLYVVYVFFTLSRFLSTRRHPAHPVCADSSSFWADSYANPIPSFRFGHVEKTSVVRASRNRLLARNRMRRC